MTFTNITSFSLVPTYNTFKMSEYSVVTRPSNSSAYLKQTNNSHIYSVKLVFEYQTLPSKNQVLCRLNHC